jgi:hypothetical protein
LAKLASPIAAEMFVVNRRFLSQFRVPGENRLAKLAPPIWLGERGLAHSQKQEELKSPNVYLGKHQH